jgi:hypothetical protein
MLPCNHCPQNNQYKTGILSCSRPYCPIDPRYRVALYRQIRNLEALPRRSAMQEEELHRLKTQWATDLMLIGQRPPGGGP